MISSEEKLRYARMISMPEIGLGGITKLKQGKVFIIGAGALGSLCAMYLSGAGIGKIGIADFDTIDVSNLHRQLFFDTETLGKAKVEIISSKMKELNPTCNVIPYSQLINKTAAKEIFVNYDFIIDATDNPSSKFMTDEVCQLLKKKYVIGGVSGFKGQVISSGPGHIKYSDIFTQEGVCSGLTPCSISGVIGPAAGVISCIEANEAIKHLTQTGEMLYDKLFTIDLASMNSHLYHL